MDSGDVRRSISNRGEAMKIIRRQIIVGLFMALTLPVVAASCSSAPDQGTTDGEDGEENAAAAEEAVSCLPCDAPKERILKYACISGNREVSRQVRTCAACVVGCRLCGGWVVVASWHETC